MDRWDIENELKKEFLNVDSFLNEIINLCKKHDLSISHEDGFGAFIVENGFNIENAEWLLDAHYSGMINEEGKND